MINARRRGAVSRRRQAQRRARLLVAARRALGVAAFVAVCAGAVWGARELLAPGRFVVSAITLDGRYDAARVAEIEPLLTHYWRQNFFALDVAALRDALLADPWMSRVAVRREWPLRLRITLRQRQPAAYWGDDELLDAAAERFRPPQLPAATLPRLHGPPGQERVVLDAYRRAARVLAGLGLRVVSLRQDARLAWTLTLDNRIRLVFSKDDLGNGLLIRELRRFARAYDDVLAENSDRIDAVDLRYRRGFAVRWLPQRQAGAAAAAASRVPGRG